jgi:hypothetical protein
MDIPKLLESANFLPRSINFPNAWCGHLPFASWLIRTLEPDIFVELGTHSGNSYFSFCQAVFEDHLKTKCFAVDTWQGDEHAGYYNEEVFQQVNSHNQLNYANFSRLLRMTFDEAVNYFSNGSVDLLHIDGLHTYEAVKHDFETWQPKLKPGAIVLFHDTNVREQGFGVWKFWEETQIHNPNNLEFLHSHGLGVIQMASPNNSKNLRCLDPALFDQQKFREYFSSLGERQLERYELNLTKNYVANLNQVLTDRDGQIAGLIQTLADRDGQIANLTQTVADRDGQLAARLLVITECNSNISSLNQSLVALSRDIAKLNHTADNQKTQITRLNQIVEERNTQIGGLNQALNERNHQIADLHRGINSVQQQISEITNSTSWKVTKPFRLLMGFRHLLIFPLFYVLVQFLKHPSLFPFKRFREYIFIRHNLLFDREFYLRSNPDIAQSGLDPALHYTFHGGPEGRKPTPLFDSAFYLSQYPDVGAAGMNPLVHYLNYGAAEGRKPNSLFDSAWYLSQYPDIAAAGLNPLVHYLTHGAAEGRKPNPLFDSAWYLEQYPDVAAAGLNPLEHYIYYGAAEGRCPMPI